MYKHIHKVDHSVILMWKNIWGIGCVISRLCRLRECAGWLILRAASQATGLVSGSVSGSWTRCAGPSPSAPPPPVEYILQRITLLHMNSPKSPEWSSCVPLLDVDTNILHPRICSAPFCFWLLSRLRIEDSSHRLQLFYVQSRKKGTARTTHSCSRGWTNQVIRNTCNQFWPVMKNTWSYWVSNRTRLGFFEELYSEQNKRICILR